MVVVVETGGLKGSLNSLKLCSYRIVCCNCILAGWSLCSLLFFFVFEPEIITLFYGSFFWVLLEYIHGLGEEFWTGNSPGKRENKNFALEYLTWFLKFLIQEIHSILAHLSKITHDALEWHVTSSWGHFCRKPLSIHIYSKNNYSK